MRATPVLLILTLLSFAVCVGTATAASAESFVVLPEGSAQREFSARVVTSSAEQDADFFTDAISAKATAADTRGPKSRGPAGPAPRADQFGS